MQDVVGNEVVDHEPLDIGTGPVGERVDLDQAARLVGLGEWRVGAVGRLPGAKAGEPSRGPGERPAEGFDLAEAAAGLPRRHRMAEAVDALARDEFLLGDAFRRIGADADAVGRLGLGPHVVGLRVEPARIEGDDLGPPLGHGHGMGQRLILDAEAGREDEAAGHARFDEADAGGELEVRQREGELTRRPIERRSHRMTDFGRLEVAGCRGPEMFAITNAVKAWRSWRRGNPVPCSTASANGGGGQRLPPPGRSFS